MENEIVIDVKNVEKSFRVYKDKGNTIKSKVLFSSRRAYEERKVLRGISFQVRRGEAIGLIGHNGCGKSTTLKLLTRIIYPDKGSITMKGRVSSLIELGAGFHPDMTGRENIYINASIFGLTRGEIDRRLGDIIAFSELGDAIDTPVRTYSSGMYMRLAFSVAINVDADILLIDEILAVGDAGFQAKCFNKLMDIKRSGTTIVIVSHSLGQIEQFCERSYWIDEGVIRMAGVPAEVHASYLEYMEASASLSEKLPSGATGSRWGNWAAIIDQVKLLNAKGEDVDSFQTSEKLTICMEYHLNSTIDRAVCGFGIYTMDGLCVFSTNTALDRQQTKLKERGVISCEIQKLELVPGEYKLDVALHDADGIDFDHRKDVRVIQVHSEQQEEGIAHLERSWEIR